MIGERLIAAVAFITKAVEGFVRRHKYISSPADILAINRPAAVVSYCGYVLASHLDLLETSSHIKCLTYVTLIKKFQLKIDI